MVLEISLLLFPFRTWMDTTTLLLFSTVFLLTWDRLRNRMPPNYPPGPVSLPILGSFFSVDSKQPHICLTKMTNDYGNIFCLRLGYVNSVVVNTYTMVKEALIDKADIFAERPPNPVFKKINKCQGIAFNNGYSWKQQRRFMLGTLRTFGVGKRNMESNILEELSFLHKAFKDTNGESFNPHFLINNAVSNVICYLVFGRRFEYTDERFLEMLSLMSKAIQLEGSPWAQIYNAFPNIMELLPGPHKEIFSCFDQVCVFLNEEIKKHQAERNPSSPRDFMDCYLNEIEKRKNDQGAGFTLEGLCYTALDLFVAGTETTSTTLLWSFKYMMMYPEIQEKVQAEIDRVIGSSRQPSMSDRANMPYTDAVIHEVQRFGNIVPLNVPRSAIKDTTLGGYFIPKGTQIIPNLTSVLFDETQWKSPHTFDPQNFLNPQGEFVRPDAFLPFSAGKRICPGESLARMELFLFFTSLLQVFTLSPAEGTRANLDFQFGLTLSPKPFRMTASPRNLLQSKECYI